MLGIADSKHMITSESGIDLDNWRAGGCQLAEMSRSSTFLSMAPISSLSAVSCWCAVHVGCLQTVQQQQLSQTLAWICLTLPCQSIGPFASIDPLTSLSCHSSLPFLLLPSPPPHPHTHTTVWSAEQEPADLSLFGKRLTAGYIPNLAIVDCTASDKPPSYYLEWMGEGINIITPNKKLGSGPLGQYQAVKKVQRESYIHFFYEVGPGW